MRFLISRTSGNGSNGQPCSEATYQRTEREDAYDWFVEFNNLNDLLSFCVKHGSVILGPPHELGWHLEIYDAYRE